MIASESWTWRVFYQRFPDEETSITACEEMGLIPTERLCKKHHQIMISERGSHLGFFRCKRRGKSHKVSRAKHTWFERCKLSVQSCLQVTYCFARGLSYEDAAHECSGNGVYISRETIADRYSFAREVCMLSLDQDFLNEGKIGGCNIVVEIDETKIGKRKYERGRIVEGNWILGMIERSSKRIRFEICPNNNRSEEVLTGLIKKHVLPSTEIHTDCWRGYINLNKHGYVHRTVNHTENFVDPATGAHTQSIEGTWRGFKARLGRGGIKKKYLDYHMCEFLWRRRVKEKKLDPFEKLLNDIKNFYNGK